ncbi:hypothetical protein [Streptomyces sp. NPDC093707]|uniref:SCO2584 family spore wall biosynthesis protein n=1 Tax=Streptomyces sp. NPDC093707 TaxID=3154984 RepID=UPI00344E1B90
MPDDAGGTPFPDGEEPDEHHHGSHGRADEEFASVVFDEEFVRAATLHEPSAVERMLAAAEARAEADAAARPGAGLGPDDYDHEPGDRSGGPDAYAPEDPYGPYGPYGGSLRPYRGTARWHRPVAWVLAVLMGIGLVALAFSAVYRGASGRGQNPAPPASSSGVDVPASGAPPKSGPDSLATLRPGVPTATSAEPLRPSFSAGPGPR